MRSIELEKVEAIVDPVVRSIGCEMIACEWLMEQGRWTLRVLIDKPGGIHLSDCEHLSHLLSPVLDVEDLIPQGYNLEVSSPGLDRPLKKLADFEHYSGNQIRLSTKIPIENRSHFKGELKGVEGETILVEVDKILYSIPHKEVYRAKLEVDWGKVMKKGKK
jgi:ribosome maturation factor RimP